MPKILKTRKEMTPEEIDRSRKGKFALASSVRRVVITKDASPDLIAQLNKSGLQASEVVYASA